MVPDNPQWLLMYFHSARADSGEGERLLAEHCAREGIVLVCPTAIGERWDLRPGQDEGDLAMVEAVLAEVAEGLPMLRGRLALGGFGDGASFALSVGLANGDLIRAVVAFAPGYLRAGDFVGAPAVLLAHGLEDSVLPVSCSHRIAETLEEREQPVSLMEFQGGHAVPAWVAAAAMSWLTAL